MLFFEVHDAVSGEIFAPRVDTREDPDNGYFEWADRINNIERARLVAHSRATSLAEGLDELKTVK